MASSSPIFRDSKWRLKIWMGIVLNTKDSMFFVSGGFNKKNFREQEWSLFLLFSSAVVVKPVELFASFSFLITL